MSDDLSVLRAQWSVYRRTAFVRAAEMVITTFRHYADEVASATSEADWGAIARAGRPVLDALEDADLAEHRFAGTCSPFRSYGEFNVEVPDTITDEQVITVLERRDYYVADKDAVRAALRHPHDLGETSSDSSDGFSDVERLGAVALEAAGRDGSAALERLPGLELGAGIVVVISHHRVVPHDEELLAAFDEGTAFDIDGVVLGVTTVES